MSSVREDLLRLLGQVANAQSEIKLLNIYKGLPITYDTSIHFVSDTEVCVPANRQHIACLYYQGETYLQGARLPFLIRSQVMSLNLAKDDVILADFEVAKHTIGNRSQIRVEPDETMFAYVQFIGSGFEIPAPLADISTEGASIHFDADLFPAKQAKPGNELMISIPFPDAISQRIIKPSTKSLLESRGVKPALRTANWQDGKVTITARGKIVSVLQELHLNRYRVGMSLYFQDLARTVIIQYISQRQTEIIRDLHLLSDEIYRAKK